MVITELRPSIPIASNSCVRNDQRVSFSHEDGTVKLLRTTAKVQSDQASGDYSPEKMLMSSRKLRLCTWPSPVASRKTTPCLGEGWGLTKLSMSFACLFSTHVVELPLFNRDLTWFHCSFHFLSTVESPLDFWHPQLGKDCSAYEWIGGDWTSIYQVYVGG